MHLHWLYTIQHNTSARRLLESLVSSAPVFSGMSAVCVCVCLCVCVSVVPMIWTKNLFMIFIIMWLKFIFYFDHYLQRLLGTNLASKLSDSQSKKSPISSWMDNTTVVIGTVAAILVASGVAYFYMGCGSSKTSSVGGSSEKYVMRCIVIMFYCFI